MKPLFSLPPEEIPSLEVLNGLNERSHDAGLEPPEALALPWSFEPYVPIVELNNFDRISACRTVGSAYLPHAESEPTTHFNSAFLIVVPVALLAFVLCCPLRRMSAGVVSAFKTGLTLLSTRNEASIEYAALAQLIVENNTSKTPGLRD